MIRFVARRAASGAATVAAITVFAFLLLYAGGGDIARRLLGAEATPATIAQKSHELGIDRPLVVQFVDWAQGAIRGDFGDSWFTGQPVEATILSRLGVTISLVLGAAVLTAIISVVLGVVAATRRGWVDRVVQVAAPFASAVPPFLTALVLVLVFAINLRWFRPTGFVPLLESPAGWLAAITLPVIALSLHSIAGVSQQVRGSMIDAMRQDWVRTLRSRGLSSRRIVLRNVLRNAGGPALAVMAVHFVGLLGGEIVLEGIFAIPGLGQVAITATSQGDIPLVMGLVLATAVLVVVLNFVADLLQGWLNPKVRLS